jgi:hypothetical protein
MANLSRVTGSGGKELREGDVVTIELDVETLKLTAQGHGGWVTGMEKVNLQISIKRLSFKSFLLWNKK